MTPEKFIEKWKLSTLKERSASQSHFIDLCKLLDEPNPTDVDQDGSWLIDESKSARAVYMSLVASIYWSICS